MVIVLIEIGATDVLERYTGTAGQAQSVEGELHGRVFLSRSIGLVIHDMNPVSAHLKYVDMACERVFIARKGEIGTGEWELEMGGCGEW